MALRNPGFEVVGETETEARTPPPPADNGAAIRLVMLALASLSQRAVIALADLFTLLTVGSAFWLWNSIPEPNDRQIAALAIYALFVLAINWIVRRK